MTSNRWLGSGHCVQPKRRAVGLRGQALLDDASRELIFTATYCEATNIEEWIRAVAVARPWAHILIIDDNSPDGTSDLVRALQHEYPQVRLIVREGKQGLGSAHLAAMKFALREKYDVFVSLDADLSHQPAQIIDVVAALPADGFAIGTRSRGGTHQASLLRQILSKGANRTARLLLPTGLSEYTTSMRAFSPRALTVLVGAEFRHGGYAFFIESIEVLYGAGIPLSETPIDFLDRRGGHSKIPRTQIFTSMAALGALSVRRSSQKCSTAAYPSRNR